MTVSIYSLDTLSKEGAVRLSVEVLVVFGVVTAGHVLALEPILQSIAPDVYVRTGLNYGPYEFPDTASEITHLLLSVAIGASHLFWRLNCTELGETFRNAYVEEYRTDN